MDETLERLAGEWVRLAYWLPISWGEYLELPLRVRFAMFSALNEIRSEAEGNGQSRQNRKHGLES